jgi:hypothetical protein
MTPVSRFSERHDERAIALRHVDRVLLQRGRQDGLFTKRGLAHHRDEPEGGVEGGWLLAAANNRRYSWGRTIGYAVKNVGIQGRSGSFSAVRRY